jgi:hypothetical protein
VQPQLVARAVPVQSHMLGDWLGKITPQVLLPVLYLLCMQQGQLLLLVQQEKMEQPVGLEVVLDLLHQELEVLVVPQETAVPAERRMQADLLV